MARRQPREPFAQALHLLGELALARPCPIDDRGGGLPDERLVPEPGAGSGQPAFRLGRLLLQGGRVRGGPRRPTRR